MENRHGWKGCYCVPSSSSLRLAPSLHPFPKKCVLPGQCYRSRPNSPCAPSVSEISPPWCRSCSITCQMIEHDLHHGGEISDRKSTRLNSSHGYISYAVFCLKKKKRQLHLDRYVYKKIQYIMQVEKDSE